MIRHVVIVSCFLGLGGCWVSGEEQDMAEAERTCKDFVQKGVYKDNAVCVKETYLAYRGIRASVYSRPAQQPQVAAAPPPIIIESAPAAVQPLPNILPPPPVTCMTVPMGMGMTQVHCH